MSVSSDVPVITVRNTFIDVNTFIDAPEPKESRFRSQSQPPAERSRLLEAKLEPDVIVYSAGISACEKGDEWQQAPVQAKPQIFVETLGMETLTLNVTLTDTVESVKAQIQSKTGDAPDWQQLIFNWEELDDGRTLSDCGVQDGSKLQLTLRLRGGGLRGSAAPDGGLQTGVQASAVEAPSASQAAACGAQEVVDFLANLNLDRYGRGFLKNGYDNMEIVMMMTEKDMSDLGVFPGHIIKLLKALGHIARERQHVDARAAEEPPTTGEVAQFDETAARQVLENARKVNGVTFGLDKVTKCIQGGKALEVFLAGSDSEVAIVDRVQQLCKEHSVPCALVPVTKDTLGVWAGARRGRQESQTSFPARVVCVTKYG